MKPSPPAGGSVEALIERLESEVEAVATFLTRHVVWDTDSTETDAYDHAQALREAAAALRSSLVSPQQTACDACGGKGHVTPEDAERGIQSAGELFESGYDTGKRMSAWLSGTTSPAEPDALRLRPPLANAADLCERCNMNPRQLCVGCAAFALDSPVRSSQPSGAAGWQPIETAPRVKRLVLWCPARGVVCGQWSDDKYSSKPRPYWTNDNERLWGTKATRRNQPTHWMPLPDPPSLASPEEKEG